MFMRYDRKIRESVRDTPKGLRQKVLVVCGWRNSSTTKDGRMDYPDEPCKTIKCSGIFHKAPEKDCFVNMLPFVEAIEQRKKDGQQMQGDEEELDDDFYEEFWEDDEEE